MPLDRHDLKHRERLLWVLLPELEELGIPCEYIPPAPWSCFGDAATGGEYMRMTGMPTIVLGGDLGRVRVVHDRQMRWGYIWPDVTRITHHPHWHDHAGELAGLIAVTWAERAPAG